MLMKTFIYFGWCSAACEGRESGAGAPGSVVRGGTPVSGCTGVPTG